MRTYLIFEISNILTTPFEEPSINKVSLLSTSPETISPENLYEAIY